MQIMSQYLCKITMHYLYKPRNILTSQPPRSKFALSVAERIEAANPLTDDILYLFDDEYKRQNYCMYLAKQCSEKSSNETIMH